jgi:hypothetical protein
MASHDILDNDHVPALDETPAAEKLWLTPQLLQIQVDGLSSC